MNKILKRTATIIKDVALWAGVLAAIFMVLALIIPSKNDQTSANAIPSSMIEICINGVVYYGTQFHRDLTPKVDRETLQFTRKKQNGEMCD